MGAYLIWTLSCIVWFRSEYKLETPNHNLFSEISGFREVFQEIHCFSDKGNYPSHCVLGLLSLIEFHWPTKYEHLCCFKSQNVTRRKNWSLCITQMAWCKHKALSKYCELIMNSELVEQDQEASAGIRYLIFKVKFNLHCLVSLYCTRDAVWWFHTETSKEGMVYKANKTQCSHLLIIQTL